MTHPLFPNGHARVALVVHPARPRAKELAERARAWWGSRGHEVIETTLDDVPETEIGLPVDLAVSLGGDGTMLRTIQLGLASNVPVLGVNLGSLGYLTPVEPETIESAFERVEAGDFALEELMTLRVELEAADGDLVLSALNEAVLEKTAPAHTIRLRSEISGRPFLSYVADGFLVATPTGSTAYNLSLRGPILSPELCALVLTPISPHQLFDRSLVLGPAEAVRLELLPDRPAVLVVDGRTTIALSPGDVVSVTAGPAPARIITFATRDFLKILRSKFGLTDR